MNYLIGRNTSNTSIRQRTFWIEHDELRLTFEICFFMEKCRVTFCSIWVSFVLELATYFLD